MLIRYWNSDKHKVSFLGIPKTGSSSVRATLGIHPEKDWATKPKYKKTFTVIREPFARIGSAFEECKRRGTLRKGYERNFDGFVLSVKEKGFFDEHTAPMAMYYQPVERVFLLDDLHSLWKWLCISGEKKANISDPYSIRMTSDTRALIYELYSRDFLLYNNFRQIIGLPIDYQIATKGGYFRRFFEIKNHWPSISDMKAYNLLEREYYSLFGENRYTSYNSFKNQQARIKDLHL